MFRFRNSASFSGRFQRGFIFWRRNGLMNGRQLGQRYELANGCGLRWRSRFIEDRWDGQCNGFDGACRLN
jgi:hypothetical protein